MMKSILAFAALAHFANAAVAGACAPPSITATVLTPNGSSIDQDGGVVVGLIQGFGGSGKDDKDLTKLDWKFVENDKPTAPKARLVAPGLAVLVPDKPVKQLALKAGKDTKVTVTYAFAARRDLPTAAAPNVKGIKYSTYPSPRGSSDSTDATLDAAPPASTIAVLVYDPAEQQAGKLARSWARVDPTQKIVTLGSSGRCHTILAGTRPSSPGEKVVLVWLDAQGHLSVPSKVITIQ